MDKREEKISYLESLGLSIENIISEDETSIFFEHEGNYYEIQEKEFSVGDSLDYIINFSEIYSSCCGEPLDTDFMVCPLCRENC